MADNMQRQIFSVFISSTCYDVPDLRPELADYLTRQGYRVRRSDDWVSGFLVDPQADSIQSCIENVEACDVVVCIIDRRYGAPLKTTGRSATHEEVLAALNHKPKIPVFYFIRTDAHRDYESLRKNKRYKTLWAEPTDPSRRKLWYAFVKEVSQLPPVDATRNNWCDKFHDVTDLKPMVLKRVWDHFPTHQASIALHPDHILRLSWDPKVPHGALSGKQCIAWGRFTNVGTGPAFNIRHGVRYGSEVRTLAQVGGLREGESLQLFNGCTGYQTYSAPSKEVAELVEPEWSVFCEYENRFGDLYRIEVPIRQQADGQWQVRPENFNVWLGPDTWGAVEPVGTHSELPPLPKQTPTFKMSDFNQGG